MQVSIQSDTVDGRITIRIGDTLKNCKFESIQWTDITDEFKIVHSYDGQTSLDVVLYDFETDIRIVITHQEFICKLISLNTVATNISVVRDRIFEFAFNEMAKTGQLVSFLKMQKADHFKRLQDVKDKLKTGILSFFGEI